jgi:hypothetical protein
MNNQPHIPLYANLNNHPKFLRLCHFLEKFTEDERLLIRAKLENLWLWAAQYYPDGCMKSVTSDEIAAVCCWHEDPWHFLNGLCHCGFVEITTYGVEIINWDEYAGKSHKKKQQNAIRKQRSREKQSTTDTPTQEIILPDDEPVEQLQIPDSSDSNMSHGHPRDIQHEVSQNEIVEWTKQWNFKDQCKKKTNHKTRKRNHLLYKTKKTKERSGHNHNHPKRKKKFVLHPIKS